MICCKSILESIGNTPLIRLRGSSESSRIYAKLEMFNPGGSVKDRAALSMILDAERRGILERGNTVIEATSGNTGIALAMICAVRGYNCTIVMPENMSVERRKMINAYGATIELTPAKYGMNGAIDRMKELVNKIPNCFVPDQFNNPANPYAHETSTAPEIIEAIGRNIDAFVAGIGTGGTITGVGRALKRANPGTKIIGTEPSESAVITGESPSKHNIQGIGAGFIPKILDLDILDEVYRIDTPTAFEHTQKLAFNEGIFAGISSGAAYAASLRAINELGADAIVVTLFPDGGCKYLSSGVF